MTSRLLAAFVLAAPLAAGCSGGGDAARDPDPTSPAEPRTTPTVTTTPSADRCERWPSRPSSRGAGFVVELNIMSGNPNPAWRLTPAEAGELQALLLESTAELDLDGPDDLGGFGMTADRAATRRFMTGLELPERVWVQGDGPVADFLAGTGPCPFSPT